MQNDNSIVYYNSVNEYIIKTFGHKLYKIPIYGGFTCPNRDGTLDSRGCIFCSSFGSGDFVQGKKENITKQIELGKKKISDKFKVTSENGRYIAYFQAFTNTYGPIDDLREKYLEAINNDDIALISIATRPDCISDEVISLLLEINKIKPVWIELGLQTSKLSSIDYIRRCYDNEVYEKAIIKLYNAGISHIITHIIIGLPNESKEDIVTTCRYVTDIIKSNGFDESRFGFKFQLLHILKNTDLATDYYNGKVRVLSLEEYIDILKECIRNMPNNSIVHRITGDGDKKILIEPLWSGNKKHVLNEIKKTIKAK